MDGTVHAPDFDRAGLEWFNVPEPLTLAALRGRLVILDFWTFCCINCLHVIPSLKRIEERFPDEVTVIGVHSPKFTAERDPSNLAQAIARLGIRHPVIQDRHMVLWDEYAVRAWPTLVFIAPDGRIVGHVSGEPDPDQLFEGVADLLRAWRLDGSLKPSPLLLVVPETGAGRLRFPGKIKPLVGGGWAVADAGHHQIVILDDEGRETGRFGSGEPGHRDGTGLDVCFRDPQGLASGDGVIYVADTGNHALRRIERASGEVTTLAGLGRRGAPLRHGGHGALTALASPWDVERHENRLYIANAGTHQIVVFDTRDGSLAPLVGGGGEDIEDGPGLYAQLAQPSGLALDATNGVLYVADSETSAVRAVRLGERPEIVTLVGAGLFDFGHVDGPFAEARLQHPLGLAWTGNEVVVADSYNGALRRLDPQSGTVATLDGGDWRCLDSLCRPLSEPAGVAAAGPNRLLVADTNHHRIVEVRTDARTTRTWFA